jgi:L-fucose mutarotase/ribose pyranase (RbsD/FucU family)
MKCAFFHTCLYSLLWMSVISCQPVAEKEGEPWKDQIENVLKAYGHRNWVLIVDSAFPAQNAAGIDMILADASLLDALRFVLHEVDDLAHIQAQVYTDAELDYLPEELAPGIGGYRNALSEILKGRVHSSLLHDEVFAKIDEAASLFSICVVKTTETLPYTSVFLELDCGYWSTNSEQKLRKIMNGSNN